MEQMIIRVVDYKTGRISREELEFSLGVNSEAMDTYMVNFNFFLYSHKNKKFYTSIIETKNACCSGALSENEKALFNELYTTYHFDDLIRRSLDFVKSKSSLFDNTKMTCWSKSEKRIGMSLTYNGRAIFFYQKILVAIVFSRSSLSDCF